MSEVREEVLSNGMKVLLIERHTLPVVCSMVWYRVGARDERTGETGLSHFLEHMMFKGTERYGKGQIDLITQRLGGHNNAFTDNDVTAYFFNLASDRWQTALEIEANRMRGCLLDPAEFESEKRVVLEELAMGEDDPYRPLYHAVEAAAFAVHPYHHPVIGWKEELIALSRERMVDYYARHYSPDRAVVVSVGDLDPGATLSRVRELFEPIPRSGFAREQVAQEPEQRGERRVRLYFPGNLARIAIAHRTCRVGEPEDYALDVLSVGLGAGKSSRLYKRLVQGTELVTSVSVHNDARLDPGLLWIVAELKEGVELSAVEGEILDEIARVRRSGLSASELGRAKRLILSGFEFERETAHDMATRLGRFEVLTADGHRLLERYPEEISNVDRERIRDVAERFLVERARTVGWSLPERGASGNRRAAARGLRRRAAGKRKRS